MADGTKIEWTDATINPIRARRIIRSADDSEPVEARMGWHCEHVSEACRYCYAEVINRDRFGTGLDYKPGHLATKGGEVEIVFVDKPLREMLRWRRPRRVFVCSMTDLFADFVPDWMIDRVFAAAALCPQHTIQILTKRPDRMRAYIASRADGWQEALANAFAPGTLPITKNDIERALGLAAKFSYDPPTPTWPLPNVWLGVTAERQQEADERIPILLATPAAKRLVSIEPMLGPVDLRRLSCADPDDVARYERGETDAVGGYYIDALTGDAWDDENGGLNAEVWGDDAENPPRLDWVICGGESGPGARPMHPDWARSLRDQCASAGTPFLFKQWGEFQVAVDRSRDDPDWRLDYSLKFDDRRPYQWLNLAGGCGFHGERFHVMQRVGKARAGRLLDGVEHNAFPER